MRGVPGVLYPVGRWSAVRNQKMANWIFCASAVFFAAAFYIRLHEDSLWTSVLYFTAQSALIGGAADWFAVTALFRKPLGFPFHTALIPRNRARIIAGIRRMVETRLVRPELWKNLAESFSASETLRLFLETEKGKSLEARLAEEAAQMAEGIFLSEKMQLSGNFEKAMPGLARRLCDGWKQMLLRKETAGQAVLPLLEGAEYFLSRESTRAKLVTLLKQWTDSQKKNPLISMAISMGESMGLIQYEEMADALLGAGTDRIHNWQSPESPMQTILCDKICQILNAAGGEKALDSFLLALADEILAGSPVKQLERGMKENLAARWKQEGIPAMEKLLEEGLRTVLADERTCRMLDREAQNLLISLALYEHSFIGETVEAVLASYDDRKLNAFVENKVGEELGWIRINGSLVAAVSGAALFLWFLMVKQI